jgi:transposase
MSHAGEATALSQEAQPLPVGQASVLDPSGGDVRYCGMDVHGKATVYCLLDAQGNVIEKGSVPTTVVDLSELGRRLSQDEAVLAGQEVGTMCHFVHDIFTALEIRILSFNAAQLRVIASSRKKTDKRDAFWLAKCLQTGMMPHPVYIPTAEVRRLRSLLAQRSSLAVERKRWLLRARSHLRADGVLVPKGAAKITRLLEDALARPDGLATFALEALELCARQEHQLSEELTRIEAALRREAKQIDAVRRLKTIPAVGDWVALAIYAGVGDVHRFRNARLLAAYAGLVPSVHQSGETSRSGGITKTGSPALRSALVQAGHVLLFRCQAPETLPLKQLATRVHTARARRKIAVVAAARHILRIAFYVLRDGTSYDPTRLHGGEVKEVAIAA